jgi:hypothetical protein
LCASALASPATKPATTQAWRALFDGKTLNGWKVTDFPDSKAKPRVEEGKLILPKGTDMTGVTWTGGDLPTTNYEIELEAQRIDGDDFFCGLTFPMAKSHASLILGGWGGGVCGISSLDGDDAARNETTTARDFKKGEWYRVLLRITPNRIQAWLEKENLVDVDTTGRDVGVRMECEESRPLGVCTWRTTGAIRNMRLRRTAG